MCNVSVPSPRAPTIFRDRTNISPVVLAVQEFLGMGANAAEATPKSRSRCVTKRRILTSDKFYEELRKKRGGKKKQG